MPAWPASPRPCMHPEYNLLVLMYDNETYANTDIQVSGMTPWGAHTSFSTPGTVKRIMYQSLEEEHGWPDAAGHPTVKYVATMSTSYALQGMNNIRKALTIGGPTFIHCLNPCPKGWDFDPDPLLRAGRAVGQHRHLAAV